MAKHHYNANFNVGRFADDQGVLWILDKQSGRCWAKKGGKQGRYDVFAVQGYNTVKDASGANDDSVEDFYTEIESFAAPVIDTLIGSAGAGRVPTIGERNKEHLVRFLWAQYMRSPFEREATLEDGTAHRAMEQAVLDISKKLAIPARSIRSQLPKDSEEMIEDVIVKAPTAPENDDSAVVHMRRMALDLLTIPSSVDAHFLTSDRSCIVEPMLQRGGAVLMPIAKNVAMRLSQRHNSSGGLVTVDDITVSRLTRASLAPR